MMSSTKVKHLAEEIPPSMSVKNWLKGFFLNSC